MDHDKLPQRETPTYAELVEFAAGLPPEEAEALLARARPVPQAPESEAPGPAPAPAYMSWEDFLARTTNAGRMAWCRKKATRANRPRLMSGEPDVKITGADVWAVLEAAKGRCEHCRSLAVESRPSGLNGKPLPWTQVGRRIGSLGHRQARFNGGSTRPATCRGHVCGATPGHLKGAPARPTTAESRRRRKPALRVQSRRER